MHDYNLAPDEEPRNYITPAYEPYESESSMPEADEWDSEAFDKYISAEVKLPRNDVLGYVVGRKQDVNGNPIGRAYTNPILDTRIYQVVFPDGDTAEYSVNVIGECIYYQVDNTGNQYQLFEDINMRISFKSHIMETYILEGPPRNGSFVLNGGMDLLFGRT
jgi:hypothetical protein